LEAIKKIWINVSVEKKIRLLGDLKELMESDTLVMCDEFAIFVINDQNPQIRIQAISLLWECEDPKLAQILLRNMRNDPDENVRHTSISALGNFVLLGELGEYPQKDFKRIIQQLMEYFGTNPTKSIKQEILKSLGYVSIPKVIALIQDASRDPDITWQEAAIIAMGRSADERWEKRILEWLEHPLEHIQLEAIKAAGELEIQASRSILLKKIEDQTGNDEKDLQILWSLSRIGGEGVRQAIQKRRDSTNDPDKLEFLELALEHLDFKEQLPDLDF